MINPRIYAMLVHSPFKWNKPLRYISLAIRKVCKTHWNHCGVLVELEGVWFVVESDIKGVVMTPLKSWAKDQELLLIPLLDGSHKRNKLLEKVGKAKYSFADLLWYMPIYILTGQFYGRKVDGYSNKPTCYEFVAWWLSNGSAFKNWYKITPNEFLEEILKSKELRDTPYTILAKDL